MSNKMKTFKDLKHKSHPTGFGNTQARMDFKNGYGVSVVQGGRTYSGSDTYEVAVFKDGSICYSTRITDDVIGYQSVRQVTSIMKRIQKLPKTGEAK